MQLEQQESSNPLYPTLGVGNSALQQMCGTGKKSRHEGCYGQTTPLLHKSSLLQSDGSDATTYAFEITCSQTVP